MFKLSRLLPYSVAALFGVAAIVVGIGFLQTGLTIRELLLENERLQEALGNLTAERQIGYAKVLAQESRPDGLWTTLRFVQTAPGNPREIVLEREFTVKGDVVHFDALIVKFESELVQGGKEQALYLWRRVYGEHMSPAEGFPIEEPGVESPRYDALTRLLRPKERQLFWEEIWSLADDPDRLARYGVQAVYGNAVYTRLQPGLIYLLKISATGQVFPEVVPDL